MGQKVNPHGLRVGVIKDWDSRWFARDDAFGDILVEDYNIRKVLKKTLYDAGIPKIEIERDPTKIRVHIHCARPGVIIGKGGTEIEKNRLIIDKIVNKNRAEKLAVYVNVVEIKQIDKNSQLVAENIASQLENRVGFRRAMKQCIGRAMRFGAKGIKVQVSGRLGGAEIARTEHYHEGTIPLQTIRADIDYGFAEANTTYGKIGVKVWIYAGEVLGDVQRSAPRTFDQRAPRKPRDNNAGGRGGYNNNRGPRDGNRGPGGPGGFNRGPREGGAR
jgi:small subunit ribosomal protein S3